MWQLRPRLVRGGQRTAARRSRLTSACRHESRVTRYRRSSSRSRAAVRRGTFVGAEATREKGVAPVASARCSGGDQSRPDLDSTFPVAALVMRISSGSRIERVVGELESAMVGEAGGEPPPRKSPPTPPLQVHNVADFRSGPSTSPDPHESHRRSYRSARSSALRHGTFTRRKPT
jgi:hypothetical protein